MIIPIRETLLNLLLRPPAPLNVFNALNAQIPVGEPPADLPAALGAALKVLKGAAITEAGVDYGTLRHHPAYAEYRALVGHLPRFDPSRLTREAALTFWINLYNGLIMDGVMTLGIRRSVTEKAAGLGFFRRIAYTVGGYRFTPDDIENGLLRGNRAHIILPGPQFRPSDPRLGWAVQPADPRIHFALNCASRSCPPVAAYDASRIDAQLSLAARGFVEAETVLDPATGQLLTSQIFGWYAADFGGEAGLRAFLAAHLPEDPRKAAAHTAKIGYRRYDWGLNSPVALASEP